MKLTSIVSAKPSPKKSKVLITQEQFRKLAATLVEEKFKGSIIKNDLNNQIKNDKRKSN